MIKKIISGGQTGADQGGLWGAYDAGIIMGGIAPKGYRTEKGNMRVLLKARFGLEECDVRNYAVRTELNVENSDGTIVFMLVPSAGSQQTINFCTMVGKPCYVLEGRLCKEDIIRRAVDVVNWLRVNDIKILNVAGNRESKCAGIEKLVRVFIKNIIRSYNGKISGKVC